MKEKTPAQLVQKLFDKANQATKKITGPQDHEGMLEVVSRYAELLLCCRQHHFLTETDPRWEILNRKMTTEIRLIVKRAAWKVYNAEFGEVVKRATDAAYETTQAGGMEKFLENLNERLGAQESTSLQGGPVVIDGIPVGVSSSVEITPSHGE